MAAVSYHDTVKDLQALGAKDRGPFARAEWFELLEESGHRPLLAVARSGASVACFPLTKTDNGLVSLTNWYAFTWHYSLQLDPAGETDSLSLLSSLAEALAERTDRIALKRLEKSDCEALAAAFRKAGWCVYPSAIETNYYVSFDREQARKGAFYPSYLEERPGKLRTTLKRKGKKVDVTIATDFSASDWADYESIYADSWKPKEGDPAMLRKFATQESAAGRYRLGIARKDGEAIAAQFWTVENGTAYIHKLAHRRSAEQFSPGTTLTAALMEHVLDTDCVSEVDFGTGDDPYKSDWMKDSRKRYCLTCFRPASPRNWPIMGKAFIRKLVRR